MVIPPSPVLSVVLVPSDITAHIDKVISLCGLSPITLFGNEIFICCLH